MRKVIILSIISCLAFFHFVSAQNEQTYGILRNMEGTYYVESKGYFYLADTTTVTVKYKNNVEQSKVVLDTIRANKLGFIDISVPVNTNFEEFVLMLKETEEFEYIDYCSFGGPCFIPNDPKVLNGEQWYLSYINAFEAWDIVMGSSSVKVAILDFGLDWMHPDIGYGSDGYKNVDETLGWNFVSNSSNVITTDVHGTKVAGVLGAKTNNTIGIAGISGGNGYSSGITLIPINVGQGTSIHNEIVDDAIIYAVDNGARVINMSFKMAQANPINHAIAYAIQNNVVLVAASGNDYKPGVSVTYPASHPDVIAVGAVQQDTLRAGFSIYGNALDVVAPGVDMLTTTLNNGYIYDEGTSYAAPIVSGIAALMLAINPNLTGQRIREIIEQTARKVRTDLYAYDSVPGRPNGTWCVYMGYGLVDAYAAVLTVLETKCYSTLPKVHGTIIQNTTWNTPLQVIGNIVIPNNVTLTITNQVKCDFNVSFIVHPGAKLILNGGTLTNACPNEMWQGITVMGDPTQPLSSSLQG
ncbi:MAG: S8 family serine peptidase, partial [Lentimicrobiaceae bacterium]|nr:S8 family serine peptidase [Lentimicrobiaceae bacterium]